MASRRLSVHVRRGLIAETADVEAQESVRPPYPLSGDGKHNAIRPARSGLENFFAPLRKRMPEVGTMVTMLELLDDRGRLAGGGVV